MFKWESIVGEWQRCIKWIRREARPIVCTVFLLFLAGILYGIAFDFGQPLSLRMLDGLGVNHQPVPVRKDPSDVVRDAAARFRAYLDCFSESGKWVYDPIPRHIPWNYVGDPYTIVCEARHNLSGSYGAPADDIAMRGDRESWRVRDELKWVWQTNSSCPWRSINRDDFCSKIGAKGNVMIVGDSINHEIQWSLINALITDGSRYERLDGVSTVNIQPYEMCSDVLGEGEGFHVSFICNAHLSTVESQHDPSAYAQPWIHILDQLHIKILLLNRGAHYERDDKYARSLWEAFTILREKYPHIHVIFRNTPPGHINCSAYSEPLSAPQDYSVPYKLNSVFHWQDFERQNILAKKIVEEFGYTYMDVYTMLSLRPEGHISEKDCLHYCVPGPLDVVVEYLYNILALL